MQKILDSDWGRIAKFVIGILLFSVALSNTLPLGMTVMAFMAGFIAMMVAWSGACPLFAVTRLRALKQVIRSGKPK